MGLLRAADGSLQASAALPRTEPSEWGARRSLCPSLAAPLSLGRKVGVEGDAVQGPLQSFQ